MFSVPLFLLKRRTNYNSTLICIRSVSVCIYVSLSVTALLRSVDCRQSFSRRPVCDLYVFCFGSFLMRFRVFLSAAFPGLLFGLLSAFFALGCRLVLRRNFVPLCRALPCTRKGLHPVTPYKNTDEVTVGFADLVNFFLHFLFICAIIST